jgi:WD40 repeat protein
MVFSPDSKFLVSGGDDGLIVLWDLSETSWRERACRMANRNLTKEEWLEYVGDSKPFELLCPP